ncbi:MAG TPA: hypothetical protein VF678_10600 [bacterium]
MLGRTESITALLIALGALLVVASCGAGGGGSMSSSDGTTTDIGACEPASTSNGPYCLTFVGTGYDVHLGEKFQVALVEADGTTVVTGTTVMSLPSASFMVHLPRAMMANVPYYVDYYADHSGNGMCNPPALAGDHVWRSHTMVDFYHGTIHTVTATTEDVTFTAPHDDPFVNDPTGMNTCAQLNQVH